MKIRTGFVSNSSTSSFLIYGVAIEDVSDLRDKLLEKYNITEEEFEDDYEGSVYELVEKEMEDVAGFEWHEPGDYDTFYIGKSWHLINDDETGAQFKANVEKTLKEKFGDDLEFETLSEAWRDG